MAVCGIVGYFARPTTVKKAESLPLNTCINNMRKIDAAKEEWAIAGSKTNGMPVATSDLERCIAKYQSRPLVCPKGGVYRYGDVGQEPSCGYHGTISEAPAAARKREKQEATAAIPGFLLKFAVAILVLVVAPIIVITTKNKQAHT